MFKKKPKKPGDIIILHICTKNLDDIISSSEKMKKPQPYEARFLRYGVR